MELQKETELPEDIINYKILTRLPPKCLVRFMLVQKSWKALFSSSEFVNSHLIQQQSYKGQEHVIAKNSICRDGFQIISHSADVHAILGPSHYEISVGSINGLVCMASSSGKICIWNPAIGQIKKIHRPPCHSYPCCSEHIIGFSWEHKRNDYKVVIVCNDMPTSMKLFVYSSISSCWTEVFIPADSVIPKPNRSMSNSFRQVTPCTIVKGVPYWECVEYKNSSLQRFHVYKFVSENNEFRPLLDLCSVGLHGKDLRFVNIRDCPSVLVFTTKQRFTLVDIYVLDDKSSNGVWSKMCSTIGPKDINLLCLQCFKNSGDMLILKFTKLYIYDLNTKKWKSVDRGHHYIGDCHGYTPSLVCVEGMHFVSRIIQEDKRVQGPPRLRNLM